MLGFLLLGLQLVYRIKGLLSKSCWKLHKINCMNKLHPLTISIEYQRVEVILALQSLAAGYIPRYVAYLR